MGKQLWVSSINALSKHFPDELVVLIASFKSILHVNYGPQKDNST